jgi:hypothetical protein
VNDPTKHEVVALGPWHVQLWQVDHDCDLYDSPPTTSFVGPPSLHVPQEGATVSIATLRQFLPDATAMLIDLSEAQPLICTDLNVRTLDGGQLISG